MSSLIIAAYLAGLITVLTPCVLPFLPVILGSSLGHRNLWRPVVIILSLGLSIILFGIIFQLGTKFLGLPRDFWIQLSSVIIIVFGIITLFPELWEKVKLKKSRIGGSAHKALDKGVQKRGLTGAALIGVALGPVFSGCSPTFVLILSIIIPASLVEGIFYLWIYTLGIATLLSIIAIFGQTAIRRLKWATDPKGWFKRIMGLILIIMGVMIFFGWEKDLEAFLLSKTPVFDGITNIEIQIKDLIDDEKVEEFQ